MFPHYLAESFNWYSLDLLKQYWTPGSDHSLFMAARREGVKGSVSWWRAVISKRIIASLWKKRKGGWNNVIQEKKKRKKKNSNQTLSDVSLPTTCLSVDRTLGMLGVHRLTVYNRSLSSVHMCIQLVEYRAVTQTVWSAWKLKTGFSLE